MKTSFTLENSFHPSSVSAEPQAGQRPSASNEHKQDGVPGTWQKCLLVRRNVLHKELRHRERREKRGPGRMGAKAGEKFRKNAANQSTEWPERFFQALEEGNAFIWWKMFTECILECYTGVNTYRVYSWNVMLTVPPDLCICCVLCLECLFHCFPVYIKFIL